MLPEEITISAANFEDQGKLAEYLIEVFYEELQSINDIAAGNGMPKLDIKEELLAADDFYFSTVELMDCCILAKDREKIIGVCCVNPYTSTLQYLSIKNDYRRKGIGSRILSLGKKVLSGRSCSHIKLDIPESLSNEATLAFFEKNKVFLVARNILLSGKIF